MPFSQKLLVSSVSGLAALAGAALADLSLDVRPLHADALLLVDVDSGKVIHGENATYPWYPASVTKLMTTYVTLKAVRDQRISLDTVFAVSPNAVAQQPSKMGFKSGTQVTVDNALKMLLVHSANDMAVVLAEGVSGSIEKFSDEMNAAARRLGMTQTSYVNPNGLPADDQVTTARDLAKLSRAIVTDFPEFAHYWSMPQMRLGKNRVRSHNGLLDTVEGADGMKTGFTCDSGFNIVASATRDGRRLVAVVLGDSSIADRNTRAAGLLEYGFQQTGLTQVFNTQTVDSMPLNPSVEGVKSVRASIESWACNPKPHIINAHKGGKKTAKKGAKKDRDAVKAAQANTEADTTTGALQTEVKPVLRAEEE